MRTLRAGEGYLGQSSKDLLIGLPPDDAIARVTVRWPSGLQQDLGALSVGAGQMHVITEGQDPAATPLVASPILAKAAAVGEEASTSVRIIPHAKLPLPELLYVKRDGKRAMLHSVSENVLVVLWASWCQPCLQEIAHLANVAGEFKKAGLTVLLVNVEDETHWSDNAIFAQGQASAEFLDAYDVVQRALPGREREPVLPSSFLVSSANELLALYRGSVRAETILEDLSLATLPRKKFRDAAVPFDGTWLIRSMPTDLLSIPNRLLELERPTVAYAYLERHITKGQPASSDTYLPSIMLTRPLVSQVYHAVGQQLVTGDDANRNLAKNAFVRAIQYQPRFLEARVELGLLHDSLGEHGQAVKEYRQALQLSPSHLTVANSLAWILATTSDTSLRQAKEAEAIARRVSTALEDTMPEPLDTLAAALAAQGKFEEAIATAERALKLAETAQQQGVVIRLQERLTLYRQGQAYVQSP